MESQARWATGQQRGAERVVIGLGSTTLDRPVGSGAAELSTGTAQSTWY